MLVSLVFCDFLMVFSIWARDARDFLLLRGARDFQFGKFQYERFNLEISNFGNLHFGNSLICKLPSRTNSICQFPSLSFSIWNFPTATFSVFPISFFFQISKLSKFKKMKVRYTDLSIFSEFQILRYEK